jgi:hypothetical protein
MRSDGCCVSGRAGVELCAVACAAALLVACERSRAVDPDAEALTILAACGADSACARERWLRDPRNWNVGLRAEVAGRGPSAPWIVETTRAIIAPALRAQPCFADVAKSTGIYYRTAVSRKGSDEFSTVVFHWNAFDAAAAGHRRVVAAVADARGEPERLWPLLAQDPMLDAACVRFRGQRDRCQVGGVID